ncbi:hypothetical protein ABIB73_005246 [Bradyrhizobium sp. F1.4.3]|uniref:hypothetical protein n=1 Tax=Bradyrhizobium sp. F1.4.3 TaxID=3156356 RepID=UPI00339AC810
MSSKGKSSQIRNGLSQLINAVRDADECWPVIRSWGMVEGHDRANAIVASALLEQSLEDAILTHLRLSPVEARALLFAEQEGGISTFAMKIKLAYAMGIIEDFIRSELTKIKNIRNVFAHTRADVTFQTPEIVDACNSLAIPEVVAFGGILGAVPVFAKLKYARTIELIYLYLAYELETNGPNAVLWENSRYYRQIFLREITPEALAEGLLQPSEPSSDTQTGLSTQSPQPDDSSSAE